jgi:hypothetical protein
MRWGGVHVRARHRSPPLSALRSFCMQMAELPQQKCQLSVEQLVVDGKKLDDLCRFCKKRGVDVEVGDHKSRDAPSGQHHSAQRAQPLS